MKRLSLIGFVLAVFAGGVVVGGRLENAQAERPAESCPAQLARSKRSVRKAQDAARAAQEVAAQEARIAESAQRELQVLLDRERKRVEMLEKAIGQRIQFLPDEPAPPNE